MKEDDEKNISKKEVYQLWWEYLKRSEKYKIFCDFVREPIQKLKKGNAHRLSLSKELIISAFRSFASVDFDNMQNNYEYFGDIFTDSFDDWWTKKKQIRQTKLPIIVLNNPDACEELLHFSQEHQKRQKSRKKHMSSKEILKILTKSENDYIFLAVPMVGGLTVKEISNQIIDIRKKWADKFDIQDYHFRRFNMPVSRVRYTELKRYLDIYDQKKQGYKMKEIIKRVDPDRIGEDANILRSFYMDLQKAKRIINNVEYGSFPEMPFAGKEFQFLKKIESEILSKSHSDQ